jgi:hypothetical protein
VGQHANEQGVTTTDDLSAGGRYGSISLTATYQLGH